MRRAVCAVDDPERVPPALIDQVLDDSQLGSREGSGHHQSPDRKGNGQKDFEGAPGHPDDQYTEDKILIFSRARLPVQEPCQKKDSFEDCLPHAFLHKDRDHTADHRVDHGKMIQPLHTKFKRVGKALFEHRGIDKLPPETEREGQEKQDICRGGHHALHGTGEKALSQPSLKSFPHIFLQDILPSGKRQPFCTT